MPVAAIDQNSPYFEQVITLARANSQTLGFLPKEAFIESTHRRNLLVATDDTGRFLGYLLYGVSWKKLLAYIIHLCVRPECRKQGVAYGLVQELKAATENSLRGIRVRCRRDFEASNIWPNLGFTSIGEMPGRGKKESTLTIWWFDYGQPTLFTSVANLEEHSKLRIAIDANVFFKLNEPTSQDNEECKALLADWLTEAIELCITNELFNEINRHPHKAVRTTYRTLARKFRIVSGSEDEFQQARVALRSLFPSPLSASDKSDIHQIARSIAADIQFFVTLDPRVLKISDEIFEALGIRVLRPADLILSQDYLIREAEYQPVRLAGASIAVERARPLEQLLLNDTFRAPQGETKNQFTVLLNSLLANPLGNEVKVVKEADRPRALFAFKKAHNVEFEIPILRVDRRLGAGLASTLTRYLVQDLISTSAKQEKAITRITEQYLPTDLTNALTENGFTFSNGTWVKINLKSVMAAAQILEALAYLERQVPSAKLHIHSTTAVLEAALAAKNTTMLLSVEKALWPVKIREANIPTFIVPIRPGWAMHLFDSSISSQDLFGGNPNLIFRVENAYYRNVTPGIILTPGRVFWYVSKHTGKYHGTESIKACSYLEDVVIDRPKPLFSRFRHLGVYKWDDLLKLAKQDLQKKIMGFRFAKTEILPQPIDKNTLQKIWREQLGKNFHIQSPIRISDGFFFELYSMSMSAE